MKKLVSVSLSALLTLSLFCVPVTAEEETAAEEVPVRKTGVLTMLNITEDEMEAYEKALRTAGRQLREEGAVETVFNGNRPSGDNRSSRPRAEHEVVYYDTLDAMLMALNAGDIDNMLVYESTGDYIDSPELEAMVQFTDADDQGHFAEIIKNGIMSNDFAFMMMDDNTALRDEFNDAITAIREDGTLDELVEEHINKAAADKSITPAVELPSFEDADTIKVAVTGSLPPMDYVGPDGAPAGFSTAVLAEIGKRLGKNIEIVVVDSVGRAAALASGAVDAVFWTRTNASSNRLATDDEETKKELIEKGRAQMSDEELEVFDQLREEIDFSSYGSMDMPEGTIITDSYYSDRIIPVTLQETIDKIKAGQ